MAPDVRRVCWDGVVRRAGTEDDEDHSASLGRRVGARSYLGQRPPDWAESAERRYVTGESTFLDETLVPAHHPDTETGPHQAAGRQALAPPGQPASRWCLAPRIIGRLVLVQASALSSGEPADETPPSAGTPLHRIIAARAAFVLNLVEATTGIEPV
jgi:hypothetical protein